MKFFAALFFLGSSILTTAHASNNANALEVNASLEYGFGVKVEPVVEIVPAGGSTTKRYTFKVSGQFRTVAEKIYSGFSVKGNKIILSVQAELTDLEAITEFEIPVVVELGTAADQKFEIFVLTDGDSTSVVPKAVFVGTM